MSKTIVTFEKNWRGYAAGETAGFDVSVAASLVEAGYASEMGKQAAKKGKAAVEGAAPAAKKAESDAGAAANDKANELADDNGKP